MKKLFIAALIILFCSPVSSSELTGGQLVGGSVPAIAESCDDCSGDVKFAWHLENVDVTLGTPCGCVDADGDEIGTANGGATLSDTQKQDGTNSLYNAGNDYYSFDVSSNDIIDLQDQGAISFYIWVNDWTATGAETEMVGSWVDNQNRMGFYFAYDVDSTDFAFRIEGNDDVDTRYLSNQDMSGVNQTWIRMIISWDLNEDALDSLWLWVDVDGDGVVDVGEDSESTTGTVGNMQSSMSVLRIGAGSIIKPGNDVYYLDNIYITGTYQNSL